MLDEIKQQVEQNVAPLVSGIFHDAEKLVRQEISLAKAEMREDYGRLKTAVAYYFCGGALAFSATILLSFSLVHGVAAALPELPLWAAFAGVTLGLYAIAIAALYIARTKMMKVKIVPEQTVETIKEHTEWIQRKV